MFRRLYRFLKAIVTFEDGLKKLRDDPVYKALRGEE